MTLDLGSGLEPVAFDLIGRKGSLELSVFVFAVTTEHGGYQSPLNAPHAVA
jgi:hypothetical protein